MSDAHVDAEAESADTIPLELEDYFKQELLTGFDISPDGEQVVFVVREATAEKDWSMGLYVAPSDGSEPPRRLTRRPHVRWPRWSPDGERVGFISRRGPDAELSAYNADSHPTPPGSAQVWELDVERGGDARQVTTFNADVQAFDWSPEGDRIVAEVRDPTEQRTDGPIIVDTVPFQHAVHGESDATRYLYIVDRETRSARRLDDAYGSGAWDPLMGLLPRWGPNGRIAFLSSRIEDAQWSDVVDAYTISPDGSDLTRVTDGDMMIFGIRWSPDGERIGLLGRSPESRSDPSQLLVGTEQDGVEPLPTEKIDRLVTDAVWIDEDTLVGKIGDEGRTRLVQFDVAADTAERVFKSQPKDTGVMHIEYQNVKMLAAASGTVCFGLTSPDDPGQLYTTDAANLQPDTDVTLQQITETNPDIRQRELPDAQWLSYESFDGTEIEGFALFPPGVDPDEAPELPTVAVVHEGSGVYDEPEFQFQDAYWAGQGYLVFRCNYRRCSSYGEEFAECTTEEWGRDDAKDILAGIDELEARGWADPDREFVTGFCGGATLSAFLLERSDRFAAAALERGVYDFSSTFGTSVSTTWQERNVGLPWEETQRNQEMSPISNVDQIDTPTLVNGSGEDQMSPHFQSELLYASLKRIGVPTKYTFYPEERHALIDPENAVHRLEQLSEWFEEYDPSTDG